MTKLQAELGKPRAKAVGALLTVVLGVGIGIGIASHTDDSTHHGSAEVPSTADIGFAQDMIQHHQQAVTMSDIALQRGSERIRLLANVIRSNQLQEIGQMQGLLSAWSKPWLSETGPMAWTNKAASTDDGDGHEHAGHGSGDQPPDAMPGMAMTMTGMANEQQLQRLRTLSGTAFDRYFLRLMVWHHEGALPMADDALTMATTNAVRDMAARIKFEQSTEIIQMSNAERSAGGK